MINQGSQNSTKSVYTRRTWSSAEDEMVPRLFYENLGKSQRLKKTWDDMALEMNMKLKTTKTGKQCRWLNQLRPGLSHQRIWTQEQVVNLFEGQCQWGSKWTKIAKCLPGRTDNSIKNFFNSVVRKAMRVVNRYLKAFPDLFQKFRPLNDSMARKLIKIANVEKNNASQFALKAKKILLELQKLEMQQLFSSQTSKQISKEMNLEIVKNIVSDLRIVFSKKMSLENLNENNESQQKQEKNQMEDEEDNLEEDLVKNQDNIEAYDYKNYLNYSKEIQNSVKIEFSPEIIRFNQQMEIKIEKEEKYQREKQNAEKEVKEEYQDKEEQQDKKEKGGCLNYKLMIP